MLGDVAALWRSRLDGGADSTASRWSGLHPDFEVTDLEARPSEPSSSGLSWRPTNRSRTCGSCSTLPDTGIDIKVVSDRLGHSTMAVTADLYTHVVPSLGRDAAKRIAGSGQGKARVRVAKVVEADGWQPRLLRKSLEVARDVLGPQRVAILAAEHQVLVMARVAPGGSLRVLVSELIA